jgi:serine/threonine-protein kinase
VERGSSIAGRYTLVATLGAGRSGQVWAADDARTGNRVAIKLRHEPATGLDVELAGLRTLEHPRLVRVLDAGIDAGVTWVASEIVAHGALDARGKPLAPAALEALAAQMLDALAYLHAHGILHADIKTENVFVASDDPPEFQLGDFGFARPLSAGGGLRGSPAFLAPEVIRGEPADERSDLYALGVLLYECAFGTLPFDDTDVRRVLMRHLTEAPVRLRDPGDVSPRLVALLRRLLPKDPAERPADARAALAEWRGEESALPTWVPPRLGVLVGRDAEMDALQRAFAGGPAAIAVDGPPGIGKTRLLREFTLRAELEGARVEWWTADRVSRAAQNPASLATAAHATADTAVVLVVDDVDALTAHAREQAAVRLREVVLGAESRRLVCAAGRGAAAAFLSDALAAGGLPAPQALELASWAEDDVRRASGALLGARSVHPDLVRLVRLSAGGIPAGVEAACRALVEQRWLVRGANDMLSVPATTSSQDLAHAMGHRLRDAIDSLSESELRMLRILALLRAPAALERLRLLHPAASADLPALQRMGLVTLGAITQAPEFAIAHAAARDAALTKLPPDIRRRIHDQIADALAHDGDTAGADLHRAQGASIESARAALERFVTTPQALYAPDVVASLHESLLDLWPTAHDAMARHRTQLGFLDAIYRTGDSDRAVAAAESMLKCATTASQAQSFRNRIARVYVARGDGEAALVALGTPPSEVDVETDLLRAGALARQRRYLDSLEICRRTADHVAEGHPSCNELADLEVTALIALGRLAEAEALLGTTIERCEQRREQRPLALHLSRLGVARFYQGRVSEAEAPLRRAYELYEQLGERMDQVRVLNSLAAVCGEKGNLRGAGDLLRVALDLSRRIGASVTMYIVLGNLVELLGTLGHFDEALEYAASAIDVGASRGMDQSVTPTLICRAKVLATIGAVSLCHADVARAQSQDLEPRYRAQLAMILAETALLRRDFETASAELTRSLTIVEGIGARDELVHHGLLQVRLEMARGDVASAQDMARSTAEKAKGMGLLAGAVDADVLLAETWLESDAEPAGALAASALDVARTIGLREEQWQAQRVVALAAECVGDFRGCVAAYDGCLELLRQQCSRLPPDLADAYLEHPDRTRVMTELGAVRRRLAGK